MTPNALLMKKARDRLHGAWLHPIIVAGLYWGIQSLLGCIPVLGWIASLVVTGALSLGMAIFFLAFTRSQVTSFSQIRAGFVYFTDAMLACLLMLLYIVVWSLLLIVPGIVAALGYSMTFYIMAENPGIRSTEALARSKKLMYGHRWRLFCLGCRFLGWFFLCIITLGIATIWVMPYLQTAVTWFYRDITERKLDVIAA